MQRSTARVKFTVPANWHAIAGADLGDLECDADTVGVALAWLTGTYPLFAPRLFTQPGRLASWVNVYFGEQEVRELGGLDTPLPPDAQLIIVPALAGG